MSSENIAPDSTPTCDSQYSETYSCAKAIDEDIGTRWVSGSGQPHQIELDFGSSKHIVQVRFYAQGAGGEKFTEYYIEYYDGSWHESVHVSDFDTWSAWVTHDVDLTCSKVRFRTTAGDTYTGLNELETYHEAPAAKLSGTIKEIGAPVVRTVRCHIRSTGALYDSVSSNPDGSFELNAPDDSTEMYVIAIPDGNGADYNALIFDRVKGVIT